MLRHHILNCAIASVLGLVSGAATGAPGAPHRHGVAVLELAAEGAGLTLRLIAPLESLIGFEHAPRTRAQEAAVVRMRETFEGPQPLLRPDEAAGCRSVSRDLRAPVLAAQSRAGAKPANGGEAHGDLEATFVFACERPGLLRSLDANPLFAAFPRIYRLDVQLVTPTGQAQRRLERARARLAW